MKLLMLKGLPGSGKSTHAKELARNGYVRVNKDDLRAMLNDGKWSKQNEKFVLLVRDAIIVHALEQGKSVVVDDTNFAPKHRETFSALAKSYGATFETKFFDVDVEECIKRDLKRANSVGEKVIRQMHEQFIEVREAPDLYVENPELPLSVICDIDGTLAKMGDRSPYDFTKVSQDTLNDSVAAAVRNARAEHRKIILFSGRDDSCRTDTEQWLWDNGVGYDELHMRITGDKRKDSIVKREMFEEHVRGKYFVEYVLDDRDQVVEMWRHLGLACFQVAEGAF